ALTTPFRASWQKPGVRYCGEIPGVIRRTVQLGLVRWSAWVNISILHLEMPQIALNSTTLLINSLVRIGGFHDTASEHSLFAFLLLKIPAMRAGTSTPVFLVIIHRITCRGASTWSRAAAHCLCYFSFRIPASRMLPHAYAQDRTWM